jgi:hypothetical protein
VTSRSKAALVIACLALSAHAFGQFGNAVPSPAARAQTKDDRATTEPPRPVDPKGEEKPRAARPAKDGPRGDERIRLDAPVSFPVDI